MTKRIPKDEEEKLKFSVIGCAFHFSSQYESIHGKNCLYHNFSYLQKKEKCLVKLFYATDNLNDFLDCFPTPKQNIDIRQIKDIELKELFTSIRNKREKLESLVLKKSINYCSNIESPKQDKFLLEAEGKLFDAVRHYSAYQQWKDNFNAHLKEVEWIRNF